MVSQSGDSSVYHHLRKRDLQLLVQIEKSTKNEKKRLFSLIFEKKSNSVPLLLAKTAITPIHLMFDKEMCAAFPCFFLNFIVLTAADVRGIFFSEIQKR